MLVDYHNSRWRPAKPEVEINIESNRANSLIQTVIHESDSSGDIARRWLITITQSVGHHIRFRLPPSWMSVVGQCRRCHRRVWHGRKWWGIRWNHVTSSFRSIVIFTSGLGGRPIGVRSSVNVGQCREYNTQVRLGTKIWGQLKSLRLSS